MKLTVKRTAGTEQMSVVTVGTSAVDARPGTDYESMTQELVFPAGMTSKEVSIRLPAVSYTHLRAHEIRRRTCPFMWV